MGMIKNRTLDFTQQWKAGLPTSASSASVQASKLSPPPPPPPLPPPPPPPFSFPCNFLGSFSSSFLRRRMAFSFTLRMRKNSSRLAQPCGYERECGGGKEGSSIIHRLFAQRRCGRHIRTWRGGGHAPPPSASYHHRSRHVVAAMGEPQTRGTGGDALNTRAVFSRRPGRGI